MYVDLSAQMDIEIYYRLYGDMPRGKKAKLSREDYKDYCDRVTQYKFFMNGKKYKVDALWEYACKRYKSYGKR